jgi:hypothetical protein
MNLTKRIGLVGIGLGMLVTSLSATAGENYNHLIPRIPENAVTYKKPGYIVEEGVKILREPFEVDGKKVWRYSINGKPFIYAIQTNPLTPDKFEYNLIDTNCDGIFDKKQDASINEPVPPCYRK